MNSSFILLGCRNLLMVGSLAASIHYQADMFRPNDHGRSACISRHSISPSPIASHMLHPLMFLPSYINRSLAGLVVQTGKINHNPSNKTSTTQIRSSLRSSRVRLGRKSTKPTWQILKDTHIASKLWGTRLSIVGGRALVFELPLRYDTVIWIMDEYLDELVARLGHQEF